MSVLTEKEVLSRASASDLSKIKKLNCWGSDLSDVSLLRKMSNLEVLNLSANNIFSLKDISFCSQLKELYLRKNHIELEEVKHLKNLPNLEILWLSGNPCAEKPFYKETILLNLPSVKKLDGILVTENDIENATSSGISLDFETIIYKPLNNEFQNKNIEKKEKNIVSNDFDKSLNKVIDTPVILLDEKIHTVIEKQNELNLSRVNENFNDETLKKSQVYSIINNKTVSSSKAPIPIPSISSLAPVASSIDLEKANERRKALGLKLLDTGNTSLFSVKSNEESIEKSFIPMSEIISVTNCEDDKEEELITEKTDFSTFSNTRSNSATRSNTLSAVILLLETLNCDELDEVISYAHNFRDRDKVISARSSFSVT
ncbi:leucine-rich repeat-containing protein 40 [Hydra vulgaris]|uniref:leucine-rich repeat-containing protein 40 n=1 Tax=Hydra vulgaris TaxID=6087 RepID=UPI001F5F5FC6|nr:leucine-rich repeat-containing protein 40 [Hydra vulgaris]